MTCFPNRAKTQSDLARVGTMEKVRLGSIADEGTVVAEDAAFVSIL